MWSGSKIFFIQCLFVNIEWFYVFRTLHAFEPALLRKFFAIGFAKDSSRDMEFFEMTAPIAMGIDSALGSDFDRNCQEQRMGRASCRGKLCKRSSQTMKRLAAVCTCSH